MNELGNVLSWEDVPSWREAARNQGLQVVATNGCFDLLHLGHVTYLHQAAQLGDLLVVGVNGDDSVRALKGPQRPVNPEGDRARVLAALRDVDATVIFPEMRATGFLDLVAPDIYVKGGDYTPETLDPDEKAVIEKHGGQIVIIPFVPGRSTTAILEKSRQGTD